MEIKPKQSGWNEGVLTHDLISLGGTTHLKGSIVRYKKYKVFDEENIWTGHYEWHYIDQSNYNLIRTSELLIEK